MNFNIQVFSFQFEPGVHNDKLNIRTVQKSRQSLKKYTVHQPLLLTKFLCHTHSLKFFLFFMESSIDIFKSWSSRRKEKINIPF